LEDTDGVETPWFGDGDHKRSWFVYVVKLAPEVDRPAVMDALRQEGVATAEYVPCIHLQPYMRERYGFSPGLCPVAEEASNRTLALPFFTQIDAADQHRVVEVLRAAVAGAPSG
jgi:perosamine synthetase